MVIKIGSALLIHQQTGELNHAWLMSLIEEVVRLWKDGREIVIVSSGAIGLGRRHLNLTRAELTLDEKQAAAAIGQINLAYAYQAELKKHAVAVAQILLTLEDSHHAHRRANAKNTLETLLKHAIIPIINENDAVATDEIRYGDNDRLAAHVSELIRADTLILLSDIDGLYTANPTLNPEASRISLLHEVTPATLAMAEDKGTEYGSGGMTTKLLAATIALKAGCRMVIADGRSSYPLSIIDKGQNTWFVPIDPANPEESTCKKN